MISENICLKCWKEKSKKHFSMLKSIEGHLKLELNSLFKLFLENGITIEDCPRLVFENTNLSSAEDEINACPYFLEQLMFEDSKNV